MTVKDMIKRLEKINPDKMILFSYGEGWANIELKENENDVYIECEKNPLFHDN